MPAARRLPGNRPLQCPVDFEHPWVVAKPFQLPTIAGRQSIAGQAQQPTGGSVKHVCARRRQLAKIGHFPAADHFPPQLPQIAHQRIGDRLRASYGNGPADRLCQRGQEQPYSCRRGSLQRQQRVARHSGQQRPGPLAPQQEPCQPCRRGGERQGIGGQQPGMSGKMQRCQQVVEQRFPMLDQRAEQPAPDLLVDAEPGRCVSERAGHSDCSAVVQRMRQRHRRNGPTNPQFGERQAAQKRRSQCQRVDRSTDIVLEPG
ncbi:MAG: hypothetical protein NTV69_19060 [Caldilinea sp.]|nr:hypothetical protein [Caldilinea sp.]